MWSVITLTAALAWIYPVAKYLIRDIRGAHKNSMTYLQLSRARATCIYHLYSAGHLHNPTEISTTRYILLCIPGVADVKTNTRTRGIIVSFTDGSALSTPSYSYHDSTDTVFFYQDEQLARRFRTVNKNQAQATDFNVTPDEQEALERYNMEQRGRVDDLMQASPQAPRTIFTTAIAHATTHGLVETPGQRFTSTNLQLMHEFEQAKNEYLGDMIIETYTDTDDED